MINCHINQRLSYTIRQHYFFAEDRAVLYHQTVHLICGQGRVFILPFSDPRWDKFASLPGRPQGDLDVNQEQGLRNRLLDHSCLLHGCWRDFIARNGL